MSFPNDFMYTKDHEWIYTEDNQTATIGVTEYAIDQLGDIVHMELPEVGDTFDSGSTFGTIESTKTVSDLYCPVSAKVIATNEELIDNLESLADDPYEDGWLVRVSVIDESELDSLMDAKAYEKFISEQED